MRGGCKGGFGEEGPFGPWLTFWTLHMCVSVAGGASQASPHGRLNRSRRRLPNSQVTIHAKMRTGSLLAAVLPHQPAPTKTLRRRRHPAGCEVFSKEGGAVHIKAFWQQHPASVGAQPAAVVESSQNEPLQRSPSINSPRLTQLQPRRPPPPPPQRQQPSANCMHAVCISDGEHPSRLSLPPQQAPAHHFVRLS